MPDKKPTSWWESFKDTYIFGTPEEKAPDGNAHDGNAPEQTGAFFDIPKAKALKSNFNTQSTASTAAPRSSRLLEMIKDHYGKNYGGAGSSTKALALLNDAGLKALMSGPLTDKNINNFLDKASQQFGCFPDKNGAYRYGGKGFSKAEVIKALRADYAAQQNGYQAPADIAEPAAPASSPVENKKLEANNSGTPYMNGPIEKQIPISASMYPTVLLPEVLGILEGKSKFDQQRSQYILYTIDKVVEHNQSADIKLDPYRMVNQFFCESSYKANQVSTSGAHGISQMKKSVGKEYGLKGINDLHDPYKSIDAGIAHMADLLEKYKQEEIARLAYNGGDGLVQYVAKNTMARDTSSVNPSQAMHFLATKNSYYTNLYENGKISHSKYNSKWAVQSYNYVRECHANTISREERELCAKKMSIMGLSPVHIDKDVFTQNATEESSYLQKQFVEARDNTLLVQHHAMLDKPMDLSSPPATGPLALKN